MLLLFKVFLTFTYTVPIFSCCMNPVNEVHHLVCDYCQQVFTSNKMFTPKTNVPLISNFSGEAFWCVLNNSKLVHTQWITGY